MSPRFTSRSCATGRRHPARAWRPVDAIRSLLVMRDLLRRGLAGLAGLAGRHRGRGVGHAFTSVVRQAPSLSSALASILTVCAEPVCQLREVDLVAIELRAVHARVLRLAADRDRQPPHIPVPSTMIALSDTVVGTPYGRVRFETAFIMGTGPTRTRRPPRPVQEVFGPPSRKPWATVAAVVRAGLRPRRRSAARPRDDPLAVTGRR